MLLFTILPTLFADTPAPSAWRAVLDSAAPYLVTAAAGWIGSSVRTGRKMRRLKAENTAANEHLENTFTKAISDVAETLGAEIRTMREDLETRIEQGDQRLNEVAQELWGAQRKNGLRGDIRKLKEDSETQGRLLVRIATQVEMLATKSSA